VWQAAHDCALEHAIAGQGFRLITDGESIDSYVQVAFVGLQGEACATARLYSDSGGLGPDVRNEQPGTGLVATFECVVAVGEVCLELVNPGDSVQICPPA
jgi:hypothetical protein